LCVIIDCTGSADELVLHGLRALRDTLPNEVELTTKACNSFLVSAVSQYQNRDDDCGFEFLKKFFWNPNFHFSLP